MINYTIAPENQRVMDILNNKKVKEIIVEDLLEEDFEQGNLPKKLSKEDQDKFLSMMKMMQRYPMEAYHLKFKIEFEDGEKLDIITEFDKARIRETHYGKVKDFDGQLSFIKIANYHSGINSKLELLALKSNKPVRSWMEDYLMLNEGHMYSVDGLIQAEEAFDRYIKDLIEGLENNIQKSQIVGLIQELYDEFGKLNHSGLLGIDNQFREDICGYAMAAIKIVGFYEDEFESINGIKRDW